MAKLNKTELKLLNTLRLNGKAYVLGIRAHRAAVTLHRLCMANHTNSSGFVSVRAGSGKNYYNKQVFVFEGHLTSIPTPATAGIGGFVK